MTRKNKGGEKDLRAWNSVQERLFSVPCFLSRACVFLVLVCLLSASSPTCWPPRCFPLCSSLPSLRISARLLSRRPSPSIPSAPFSPACVAPHRLQTPHAVFCLCLLPSPFLPLSLLPSLLPFLLSLMSPRTSCSSRASSWCPPGALGLLRSLAFTPERSVYCLSWDEAVCLRFPTTEARTTEMSSGFPPRCLRVKPRTSRSFVENGLAQRGS